MAILLLQVDSDEQTPIGVYPDWRQALAAAHSDAFRDLDHVDRAAERTFERAFDEAFEPYLRAPSDEGMDLQFESGQGSWDYRLVRVEVFE